MISAKWYKNHLQNSLKTCRRERRLIKATSKLSWQKKIFQTIVLILLRTSSSPWPCTGETKDKVVLPLCKNALCLPRARFCEHFFPVSVHSRPGRKGNAVCFYKETYFNCIKLAFRLYGEQRYRRH